MGELITDIVCNPGRHEDVNYRSLYRGMSALMLAAERYNEAEIITLLNAGADIELKDVYSHTALHYATTCNKIDNVKTLIDCGANIDASNAREETPLFDAVLNEHIDIIKLLIDAGANVNHRDYCGKTALHRALIGWNHASNVRTSIIQSLLNAGLNVQGEYGFAVLNYSLVNIEEYAELLLNAGANPNIKDIYGRSSLDYAHSIDVIKLLVRYGVNIYDTDDDYLIREYMLKEQTRLAGGACSMSMETLIGMMRK